ncbi:flagellar protein FliB [Pyxidicoccus fallax]|uniref:Flagellar protein FliB n=1 Tax=Pyxidicoccus fallax TaxID=394095 RepID=A0A848LW76_9BACT|nr:flagellin lysine-N-methylase [Pyxidicoccus fallax]NMO21534.1 flagellar protein FliB [Pyxidicoccus fallax]NPC85004.1 flagellar protein FliB [Pyxidicoccus fallax]
MTATAPRYLTRFRCLADTCEDTCCSGLVVPVGKACWQRLRDAVAGSPDAARVEAFVQPDEGSGPGAEDAVIAKGADGHCAFLDARKLCSLHGAHGERALPDVCATFPRAATRWGERLEVVGSLACPEVARLCLLAEDSLERVPVSEDVAVRPGSARRVGGDAEDAWTRHAEAVRATAVTVLQQPGAVSFASRMFAMGQLALRLDGFYFRGTEAFSGDARAGAEATLQDVLRSFAAPETLAAIQESFSALVLPGGPWAGICASVVRARQAPVRGERFNALVSAVLASYGGGEAPDEAWRLFAERRERLAPGLNARVEQYFRHHAVNHWLRHPFTDLPRLLDYVFLLTLRSAVLRWTLFGHPTVVALCEGGVEGTAEAQARLDAAAVECFQLIAKHVEVSPELHTLARGLAGSGGSETLGRMLVLLKGM